MHYFRPHGSSWKKEVFPFTGSKLNQYVAQEALIGEGCEDQVGGAEQGASEPELVVKEREAGEE